MFDFDTLERREGGAASSSPPSAEETRHGHGGVEELGRHARSNSCVEVGNDVEPKIADKPPKPVAKKSIDRNAVPVSKGSAELVQKTSNHIVVSGPAGEIARLDVAPNATVAELKSMISNTVGILVEEQHLLAGSNKLEDCEPAPVGTITLVRVAHPLKLLPGCLPKAIRAKDWKRCLAILDHEDYAEVNQRQKSFGMTVLHLSAIGNRLDVCTAILGRQDFTQVNVQAHDGTTALHCAAWRGNADICRAILDHMDFVAINEVDQAGRTALHKAAEFGHTDSCSAILARVDSVGINMKDKGGRTALHWGAESGDVQTCLAILDRADFAELNAKDQAGLTALLLAVKKATPTDRRHSEISAAITARGGIAVH